MKLDPVKALIPAHCMVGGKCTKCNDSYYFLILYTVLLVGDIVFHTAIFDDKTRFKD
jgi:hypothetical protein